MNLKKGLSNIAIGFLFILVSINITLNGAKLELTPDFIGWILFYLAFDQLGDYISDRPYMKWVPLAMAFMTGFTWVRDLFLPELLISPIVISILSVISAVYMFVLLGVLKTIAEDLNSPRAGTIGTLRVLNFGISIALAVLAYAIAVTYGSRISNILALLFTALGVVAIIAAIVTAVVLFKLSGEVQNS
ncbi:MAG: hypothetical protein IJM90_05235 [Firmicutes bacterium]|nr:hypothetical protein [Bacillota bacterium]